MVTGLTIVVSLAFAFVAAVAVSRFRFRGRLSFIVTLLIIQMIPVEGLFISQYKMLEAMDLLNTVIGSQPGLRRRGPALHDLDAARLRLGRSVRARGVGHDRRLLPHAGVLPDHLPAACAPASSPPVCSAFIQAWNEFTLALVVMTKEDQRTLPLWLSTFTDVNRGTDWGGIMAGSTLIAIPVVVFFLLVQGRMVAGLTAGGVKG